MQIALNKEYHHNNCPNLIVMKSTDKPEKYSTEKMPMIAHGCMIGLLSLLFFHPVVTSLTKPNYSPVCDSWTT